MFIKMFTIHLYNNETPSPQHNNMGQQHKSNKKTFLQLNWSIAVEIFLLSALASNNWYKKVRIGEIIKEGNKIVNWFSSSNCNPRMIYTSDIKKRACILFEINSRHCPLLTIFFSLYPSSRHYSSHMQFCEIEEI